jgi:histidinol-phosphate phosphatase family protein
MSISTVFLDRDGTLLEDPGYLHRLEDYALLPGVIEGLQALAEAGCRLVIISNQSGIGRGYYAEADFRRLTDHLLADLASHGIRIEGTYFCPHRPDEGCHCRKPATGMLERAQSELGVELAASWVVGDMPSDVELARRAGCRSVFVLTGHGAERRGDIPPDVPVAADLREAAEIILASQVQLRT